MVPPPDSPGDSTALVVALQRRLQARLIETHISWVLLAHERAWKIKKPVQLGFLDFGTLQARRRMCEEELRLNRRLAPALYLAVVPITGTPAQPIPDGPGPAIEYALLMRRFPDGALLSERLAANDLPPRRVDQLARLLGAFHIDAPGVAAGAPFGTAERIAFDLRAVIERVGALDARFDVDAWRNWADRQVDALGGEWSQRRRGGWVREGHGDLHLANLVVIDDGVTAFDCIEFDPAMRWIDVMADIAFPVMDLHAHGRADLAFRLLDGYLAETGDHGGLTVLRAYLAYRALVRSMVQRLQPTVSGLDYLAAARHWQARPAPRLLITHGVSGSGKSHLAAQLLEQCGAIRLRSDIERKRLFGLGPTELSRAPLADGIYGDAATSRTYACLRDKAALVLRAGWPTIVDAAFLQAGQRDAFARLARELDVPYSILHCDAPDDLLQSRLIERSRHGGDPSEADAAVLAHQRRQQQVLTDDERAHTIEAGSTPDLARLSACWQAAS